MTTMTLTGAPRGTQLTCKSWLTEAPYRMLLNNLDPELAERPKELIVYGGTGKAARNPESLEKILETLKNLNDYETLMVQSGKPVAVFKSHKDAPRVLLANSLLVPAWADWEHFRVVREDGPDHVRPDDRRESDSHRFAGHSARHLPDLRRSCQRNITVATCRASSSLLRALAVWVAPRRWPSK